MTSVELTSIRDEHKLLTRLRILDAAVDLIGGEPGEDLTIAAVASRAGVTERTVYRHFATRQALIAAVWPRMQQQVQSRGFPHTARDLVATPLHLFPNFDRKAGMVRASIYAPGGREVRLSSNAERQQAMLDCIADALPGLDPAQHRRRAAIAQLIDSAYAWDVMRTFWGFDGKEAGKAAAEALAILLGLAPADPHSSTDKETSR